MFDLQLKIFTNVMAVNSCIINLGGYVILNRGFLLNVSKTLDIIFAYYFFQ